MLLRAENIYFGYDLSSEILSCVNFTIESGEVVGLIAPSGKGKSTLGKILAGYLNPHSGAVFLDEKNMQNIRGFNPVQMVFQHPEKAVNPRWKMRKVLSETWEPPTKLIQAMGIKEEWMNRWPSELSGGELQRFCLLRALAPETKFIIADEMTSMLDVVTQAQIWEVLLAHAYQHNLGLVVISHDEALVEKICTRVVMLEEINNLIP